jgi:hypothetical protein
MTDARERAPLKPTAVTRAAAPLIVPDWSQMPATVLRAGFLEFFAATIPNKNTRMPYYRASVRFFARCDHHQLGQLQDIEPLHVAAYIDAPQTEFEKPSVKH